MNRPSMPCRVFKGTLPEHPIFWNNGDPAKTILFDAMAILTPLFEQLVLSSVLGHRHAIQDPELKKALKALLAQEAQHRMTYEQHANHCWQANGVPIAKYQRRQRTMIHIFSRLFSKRWLLSCSVATEHWTAILADTLLRHSEDYLAKAAPAPAALWYWHAVEEIEHKAVAFDIQSALKIGYWQRTAAMLWVSLLFSYFYWQNVFCLLGFYKLSAKTLWSLIKLWCGKQGLLTRSALKWLCFFKPSFHPWRHQNNASLLSNWYPKLQAFTKTQP